MLEDWLVPALNDAPASAADAIYYQPTQGRGDLRAALAGYVEDLTGLERGALPADGLIAGAGCNAVLENLCFCLAEAGDAVLIPTPYYAAFEFDLQARAALSVEPVTTVQYHRSTSSTTETTATDKIDPSIYYPNTAALDAAYERATTKGHPPKILLLSHPMNPLAICYPVSVVQECIDWCRDRQVHLISDEIYAGSVYKPEKAGFVSALQLAARSSDNNNASATKGLGLGPYVHWVYAFSKDFALSGLRVGAAYTENEEILLPIQKLNDLCQISSQTQLWAADLLKRRRQNDGELWVTAFRRENHRRLNERCEALCSLLDEFRIPYLEPTAGMFLWIDLSRFLPPVNGGSCTPPEVEEQEVDPERELYLELMHEFGLLLTPGGSMRNELPGFFRLVFTAATNDEFSLALQRLRRFCEAKCRP
jgi:aspartate/methionine/tyrosine aminotransferase